jgi:hypothetical protein
MEGRRGGLSGRIQAKAGGFGTIGGTAEERGAAFRTCPCNGASSGSGTPSNHSFGHAACRSAHGRAAEPARCPGGLAGSRAAARSRG